MKKYLFLMLFIFLFSLNINVSASIKISITANANGGIIPQTDNWEISNDNVTATKEFTQNEKYGMLPTPVRSGYVFLGWYTAITGGNEVTRNTIVHATSNYTMYARWEKQTSNDIYDVILFWGQSNMTGWMYLGSSDNNSAKDLRINNDYNDNGKYTINEFSMYSKIDKDILRNYTAINHVNVQQLGNTAFEYQYDYVTNKDVFIEITPDQSYYGKSLLTKCDNNGDCQIIPYKESERPSSYLSSLRSKGTNMIPYFAKTYYERTGHKVVAVISSSPGSEIAHFLPWQEAQAYAEKENVLVLGGKGYVYETIKDVYNKAIRYLENNNMQIGTKFYVVFQGESDVRTHNKRTYYDNFMDVHNNLVTELGLKYGVLVESGYVNGTKSLDGVNAVHNSQEMLINNNSNIILGSSYPYDMYLPIMSQTQIEDETEYNNLLEKKSLGNCVTEDGNYDNVIHFTSAALSQIGKESAENAARMTKNITVAYVISADANGGVIENTEGWVFNNNMTIGEKTIISQGTYGLLPTPTRLGYIFEGWYTAKSGGKKVTSDTIVNATQNYTMYARWKNDIFDQNNRYAYNEMKKVIIINEDNVNVAKYKNDIILLNNYTLNVNLSDNSLIYTGSKSRIMSDNTEILELTNIVLGDTNGDGKISSADYIAIRKHLMETLIITDENKLMAADYNLDDKIGSKDYVKIRKYLMSF